MPDNFRRQELLKAPEKMSRFYTWGAFSGIVSLFCLLISQPYRHIWDFDNIKIFYGQIYGAIIFSSMGIICVMIGIIKYRSSAGIALPIVGLVVSIGGLIGALWFYFNPNFIFYL